jgi:hypothetical protein
MVPRFAAGSQDTISTCRQSWQGYKLPGPAFAHATTHTPPNLHTTTGDLLRHICIGTEAAD